MKAINKTIQTIQTIMSTKRARQTAETAVSAVSAAPEIPKKRKTLQLEPVESPAQAELPRGLVTPPPAARPQAPPPIRPRARITRPAGKVTLTSYTRKLLPEPWDESNADSGEPEPEPAPAPEPVPLEKQVITLTRDGAEPIRHRVGRGPQVFRLNGILLIATMDDALIVFTDGSSQQINYKEMGIPEDATQIRLVVEGHHQICILFKGTRSMEPPSEIEVTTV